MNNMKQLLILSTLLLAAIACEKSEDPETPVPQPADYAGTVTVEFEGTSFDNEDISVSFEPSEDGATASVTIHQIKFVPQMPITIDVTIPDIVLTVSGGKTLLSCESVDPIAMGGPYPRYHVSGLSGALEGDNLSFRLLFGDFPTSFTGKKSEKK